MVALGDVVVPVVGTQIMMWGLSVPVAYFLVVEAGFGVSGLWYVLLSEEALKALFLAWRWRTFKGWKSEAEDRAD